MITETIPFSLIDDLVGDDYIRYQLEKIKLTDLINALKNNFGKGS
jgi:hypothetical protein